MRLFALLGLAVVFLSPTATMCGRGAGRGETGQAIDIGKSGTEFMSGCSHAGGDGGRDSQHVPNDVWQNEARCLGWVEGFAEGFTVHDELLGVPRADRLVCISGKVTNAQMIGVIKKYIRANPDKAHRSTRLVASLALAQAFPCRRAK